jgi:sugar/nucleoside kinase (ribokinase family)
VPGLVCCGEFYFDFIFHHLPRLPRLGEEVVTQNFALTLGGGAVITALVAAKLGRRTELVSAVGDTALDRFALEELRRGGVQVQGTSQVTGTTGGLTISVSLRKDRYFLTYRGANLQLEAYLLSPEARARLLRAGHVHFGLTPQGWRPFLRTLRTLRTAGVTTSWDLGWNPSAARQPGFRQVYALLDVVFFNREEALRYSHARTPEAALARLARPGQCVVVKLGASGAIAQAPDGTLVRARGLRVHAIDTTGAGDAFNGGFLHGWIGGTSLADCLRAGNVCGALSTTVPGGAPGTPMRTGLQHWMRRLK